jgi:hypothetical protein
VADTIPCKSFCNTVKWDAMRDHRVCMGGEIQ